MFGSRSANRVRRRRRPRRAEQHQRIRAPGHVPTPPRPPTAFAPPPPRPPPRGSRGARPPPGPAEIICILKKNPTLLVQKFFLLRATRPFPPPAPKSTRHIPKTPTPDGRDVPFVKIELSQTVVVN